MFNNFLDWSKDATSPDWGERQLKSLTSPLFSVGLCDSTLIVVEINTAAVHPVCLIINQFTWCVNLNFNVLWILLTPHHSYCFECKGTYNINGTQLDHAHHAQGDTVTPCFGNKINTVPEWEEKQK